MADEPRRRIGRDPVDRPYPWEPLLDTSVFDPTWEKAIKRAIRTVVPSTPRETAHELFLAALGGPLGAVVSAGASKVGRPALNAILKHLNPPFNPTKRKTLADLTGKSTIDQIRMRGALKGDPYFYKDGYYPNDPGSILNTFPYRVEKSGWPTSRNIAAGSIESRYTRDLPTKFKPRSPEFMNRWDLGQTPPGIESRPPTGVVTDILAIGEEHLNKIQRQILEAEVEATGKAVKESAPDKEIAKAIDDILKRFNVRRRK